jgi:glutamine amidotransferase
MIAIVDYRMGNLRSVEKALDRLDAPAKIVRDAAGVLEADKLILPGVGAFADAMTHLREQKLVEPIIDFIASGRAFLGICLGMQLLFDVGEEDGTHEGPGRDCRAGGAVHADRSVDQSAAHGLECAELHPAR